MQKSSTYSVYIFPLAECCKKHERFRYYSDQMFVDSRSFAGCCLPGVLKKVYEVNEV